MSFQATVVFGPHRIVAIAVALATGIWLGDSGALSVLCGLVGVACCLAMRWREAAVPLSIVVLWLVVGYVRALVDAVPTQVEPGIVHVGGRVQSHRIVQADPSSTRTGAASDYTSIVLEIDNATPGVLSGQELDLFVTGQAMGIEPGDRLSTIARLDIRPPPANPGQRWTQKANTPFLRTDHPAALEVTKATGWTRLRNEVRRLLHNTFHAHLPDETAALAAALLLGQRSDLSTSTANAFRDTGTGHLLAISGLHLGLIAWMLFAVVRRSVWSLRWQVLTVCTLIIAYAVVVEPRASVLRATVFAILGGVAVLSGRRVISLSVLATAAIIVMLSDPSQMYQAGAQLSFAAVLGIIAIVRFELIERFTPRWFHVDEMTSHPWLRRLLGIVWRIELWGILIWLATAPLTAYHFRWVTAWGALLHIACFPIVAAAMGILLLATVASFSIPVGTEILWALAHWLLQLLVAIVEYAASLNVISWTVAAPSPVGVGVIYATLFGLLVTASTRGRVAVLGGTIAVLASIAISTLWSNTKGELQITTLSVGHGLSVVIQLPTGQTWLYDAGSLGQPERTGERITDALLAMGVRSIDTLVISHADQDHFGSVAQVLESFRVGQVRCHATFLESDSWAAKKTHLAIKKLGVPIILTSEGDRFSFAGTTVRVLHPDQWDSFENDNANSIVLEIDFAGRRVLLTGDVEDGGLDALIQQDLDPVDVLLAPHHGGASSNTPEFAAWSRPEIVISSSGRSAAAQLQSIYTEATVFETATDGAVTVGIKADGTAQVRGYRGRSEELSPTGVASEASSFTTQTSPYSSASTSN